MPFGPVRAPRLQIVRDVEGSAEGAEPFPADGVASHRSEELLVTDAVPTKPLGGRRTVKHRVRKCAPFGGHLTAERIWALVAERVVQISYGTPTHPVLLR